MEGKSSKGSVFDFDSGGNSTSLGTDTSLGSGLAGLFTAGSGESDSDSGRVFKYQQQNKNKRKPNTLTQKSTPTKEGVVTGPSVSTNKPGTNQANQVYVVHIFVSDKGNQDPKPMGKGGLTIMKGHTMVLYQSKEKGPLATLAISSGTDLKLQDSNYIAFTSPQTNPNKWSLSFSTSDSREMFLKEFFLAKVSVSSPGETVVQDLTTSRDGSPGLQEGDTACLEVNGVKQEATLIRGPEHWTSLLRGMKVSGVRMLKTPEGESLVVKLISIEKTETVITERYKNDTAPGLPATSSKPNRVLVLPVPKQNPAPVVSDEESSAGGTQSKVQECSISAPMNFTPTPPNQQNLSTSAHCSEVHIEPNNQLGCLSNSNRTADLILTEQRLQHISMLKLEGKLDEVLAKIGSAPANCSEPTVDDLTVQNQALTADLSKSRSDFNQLESVLNSTQAELSGLKREMESLLKASKADQESQTDPTEADEAAITRKVLKATFKKLKAAFAQDEVYTTDAVIQNITEAMRALDLKMESKLI